MKYSTVLPLTSTHNHSDMAASGQFGLHGGDAARGLVHGLADESRRQLQAEPLQHERAGQSRSEQAPLADVHALPHGPAEPGLRISASMTCDTPAPAGWYPAVCRCPR